ncbi:hypothetical protein QQF64_002734 [Cirrhinus molitorella]|uniref:Uncharacterized protein n=2 Tax=Cirrhinus molitorella TaxID=172907 RepID=A0AA88P6Y0_9TELE|nr:hypothetical protein Q8A67_024057 [Cirrhinus molitorella]
MCVCVRARARGVGWSLIHRLKATVQKSLLTLHTSIYSTRTFCWGTGIVNILVIVRRWTTSDRRNLRSSSGTVP